MLIEKVKQTIKEYGLFKRGDRVLVGVSGGIDSVVLLDVLVKLSPTYDICLHVVHLDHMIRGEDSYDDSLFVQRLALKYGLGCTVSRNDARLLEKGESLEESARRVRYAFFNRCLKALSADKIALAHNADDQVETVLMRILRGTGPKGICGMRPDAFPYVRPLLKVWRSEIENYVRQNGLSYRVDITNYDTHYLRNKIRHVLLPALKEYNPSVREAIFRLAELMWLERDFVDRAVEEFFEQVALPGDDSYCFRVETLKKNRFLFFEVLREAIRRLKGSLYGFFKEDLDAVWDRGEGAYDLPKGIRIEYGKEKICVFLRKESIKDGDWFQELKVPGMTVIPSGKIIAEYVSFFRKPSSEREAFIDVEKVKLPLFVRNRRAGDRIQPLGMKGSKKLKKLLAEAGIPLEERDKVPVIVDSEGDIIWVGGIRLSEKGKVDSSTQRILRLVYKKEG